MKEIHIDSHYQSGRLDKFLRRLFVQATGGFVYKMLRKKNITLNDKKATGNEILKSGDIIRIYFSDETYEKLTATDDSVRIHYEKLSKIDCDVDIIFEDDEVIVAHKPKGMLSQKAEADDISINECLLAHLIKTGCLSEKDMAAFTPSVVNRLDRNTSGIIVFAKTYNAARVLTEWIREHQLKKSYRCIVCGDCRLEGRIKSFIKKDKSTNTVSVYDKDADDLQPIETIYRFIKGNGRFTLVEAELVTGRTHQIRSQLAHFGYPILFDHKYGFEEYNNKFKKYEVLPGQLLHAYRVVFPDGREFTDDVPAVFEEIINEA